MKNKRVSIIAGLIAALGLSACANRSNENAFYQANANLHRPPLLRIEGTPERPIVISAQVMEVNQPVGFIPQYQEQPSEFLQALGIIAPAAAYAYGISEVSRIPRQQPTIVTPPPAQVVNPVIVPEP